MRGTASGGGYLGRCGRRAEHFGANSHRWFGPEPARIVVGRRTRGWFSAQEPMQFRPAHAEHENMTLDEPAFRTRITGSSASRHRRAEAFLQSSGARRIDEGDSPTGPFAQESRIGRSCGVATACGDSACPHWPVTGQRSRVAWRTPGASLRRRSSTSGPATRGLPRRPDETILAPDDRGMPAATSVSLRDNSGRSFPRRITIQRAAK